MNLEFKFFLSLQTLLNKIRARLRDQSRIRGASKAGRHRLLSGLQARQGVQRAALRRRDRLPAAPDRPGAEMQKEGKETESAVETDLPAADQGRSQCRFKTGSANSKCLFLGDCSRHVQNERSKNGLCFSTRHSKYVCFSQKRFQKADFSE